MNRSVGERLERRSRRSKTKNTRAGHARSRAAPANVAVAVGSMALEHVVLTSVDRDDLDDGGADHFGQVVRALRASAPATTIEILTPDF